MTKLTFILKGKGSVATKICNNEKQEYRFEQDMAAKYNVLFKRTEYMVKFEYL